MRAGEQAAAAHAGTHAPAWANMDKRTQQVLWVLSGQDKVRLVLLVLLCVFADMRSVCNLMHHVLNDQL